MNKIENLYKLTLDDGLPGERGGKQIRYKVITLREITVADERIAVSWAERIVNVGGRPQLLLSEADHRYALTARHISAFHCDGLEITQDLIDLDLLGKLSMHDLALIENRVYLLNLAAKLRHGLIKQEEFDLIVNGTSPEPSSPQPAGQTEAVGALAAGTESGPSLLTDFTGADAAVATGGDGGLRGAAR